MDLVTASHHLVRKPLIRKRFLPLPRLEKEAAEKKRAVEAKKVTFAQAAKDFLEARAPTWKGRYARAQWWNPVKDYALPIIGDLLLDDMGVAHVVAVLKKVQDAPRKSDDDRKETLRRPVAGLPGLPSSDQRRVGAGSASSQRVTPSAVKIGVPKGGVSRREQRKMARRPSS
jgi:hypothetical protein